MKTSTKITILTCAALFFGSCFKKDLMPDEPHVTPQEPQEEAYDLNPNNPYSADNVRDAMKEVAAELGVEPVPIVPTHLYVRFLPADSLQYDLLLDSLHLDLFPHPLDRNLTEEEAEAYETDVSDARPYPWQYTKVPPDFVFPADIKYQFLDSAVVYSFAPGENGPLPDGEMTPDLWAMVLDRAMGAPAGDASASPVATRSATVWWTPQATVKYYDDLTEKIIPLEGVKVRVSHLLHWEDRMTDAGGVARDIGSFRAAGQYKIIWEDRYWDLRDGNFGQEKTWGDESRGPCNFVIDSRTPGPNNKWKKASMFAAVHRACRVHYYDRPFGIAVPRACRISCFPSGTLIDQSFCMPSRLRSSILFGAWSDIYIINGDGRSRWRITSTALHELGHASHGAWWSWIGPFSRSNESYATAIEFACMKHLYPDKLISDYWHEKILLDETYTNIGEALISNGITLKEIETALTFSMHFSDNVWDGWKNNIKGMNKVHPKVVDMLFAHPNERWWDFDFRKLPEGQTVAYVNTPTTYRLPAYFGSQNGIPDIKVVDWALTEGDGQLTPAYNKMSATFSCSTMGPRAITVRLKLIDGDTVAFTRRIEVTPSAYITGPSSLGVGQLGSFTVNNNSQNIARWVFKETPNDRNALQVMSKSGNSVTLYPCRGGATALTLCAQIKNSNGTYGSIAEFPLSVPAGASIVPFHAYRRNASPHDVHFRQSDTTGYIRLEMDDPRSFYAFESQPASGTGWKPVEKSVFYNGYLYCTASYVYTYAVPAGGFKNIRVEFYINGATGTNKMPLYLIEEYTVDDQNIITGVSYLTGENMVAYRHVTSWYWNWWGTKKTGDRDWSELINHGVVGYVYKQGITQN
jgi:hypothetical protein